MILPATKTIPAHAYYYTHSCHAHKNNNLLAQKK